MKPLSVEDGTDWRASDDAHMDAQGGMGSVASASVESPEELPPLSDEEDVLKHKIRKLEAENNRPVEERTADGQPRSVERIKGRVDALRVAVNYQRNNEEPQSYEGGIWSNAVTGLITELKQLAEAEVKLAPIPEERTATKPIIEVVRMRRQDCFDRVQDLIHKLRPQIGCDEVGEDWQDLWFYSQGLKPTPIPEERTAEMEQLGPAIIEAIGALRSSYNVQDFPGDGDTRQDHAANALERIWDHIEGKGK